MDIEDRAVKFIVEYLPILLCTIGLVPAWLGMNLLFKKKGWPKPPPPIKTKRYW